MELKQIYEQVQGDYESVTRRLLTEERIKKYLLKFMDSHMDVVIQEALEQKDFETAFREAHGLKGVCANLNLDKLAISAGALAEVLREGEPKGDITHLVQSMQSDYEMTIRVLNHLKE